MYSREMKNLDILKTTKRHSHHSSHKEKKTKKFRDIYTISQDIENYEDAKQFPVKLKYTIANNEEVYELIVTPTQGKEFLKAYSLLRDQLKINENGTTLASANFTKNSESYTFKINGTNTYIKGTVIYRQEENNKGKKLAEIIDEDTFFRLAEYAINRE